MCVCVHATARGPQKKKPIAKQKNALARESRDGKKQQDEKEERRAGGRAEKNRESSGYMRTRVRRGAFLKATTTAPHVYICIYAHAEIGLKVCEGPRRERADGPGGFRAGPPSRGKVCV